MAREQLFAAFFFAMFLLLLHELWRFVVPFASPLLWAGILALTFSPFTSGLVRSLGGRRGLAAAAMLVVVLVGAILPAIYLGSVLVREAANAYQLVDQMARSGELRRLLEGLQATSIGKAWNWATSYLGEKPPIDPGELAVRGANFVSQQIVGRATGLAHNVFVTIVNFGLMLVALFFFFRDGPRMAERARDLIPMDASDTEVIFTRLYDTLTAVVQGMVVTAVLQGILAGIGYWLIADISFVVFLAFLTGLAAFVPLFGPAIVWVVVALYLWVIGEPGRALGMVAWGTIVVTAPDNFVKPLIIGGRANLPTFGLLLSLLGGLQVYGFLGIFLGPVILAILITFVDIYRGRYHRPVR